MEKEEQIKGFNEAYKITKQKGFENYFCLSNTTWKDAKENFDKGYFLEDPTDILRLQENVNIILSTIRYNVELPYCKKCKRLFSAQEKKAGFEICEHCQ